MENEKSILIEISDIINKNYENNNQVGVHSGISGMALFQFYVSKFLNDDDFAQRGEEILRKCFEKINDGYNFPTYCAGIAGAAWVFEHLQEYKFVELDDDLLQDLDRYLYEAMIFNLEVGHYDFMHGGLGYGYYFLKRYKNAKDNNVREKYKKYLLQLIKLLEKRAEIDEDKIRWLSVISVESGEKGYNLSLSHGISSIISFFSILYKYKDFKFEVVDMLNGAIAYVLSFQNMDDEASSSLFPSFIIPNESIQYDSRIAWCYGDLGIGVSLWNASKSLKNLGLEKKSLAILKHSAKRTTKEKSQVVDAGFCHGSFGNAQIFNRIYQETKEKVFKEAMLFWINDGMNKSIFSDGYAGFKQWKGNGAKWQSELSILEGVAGIGLSLISYLSGDTSWDECFMIEY